jgi:hypothetical protein
MRAYGLTLTAMVMLVVSIGPAASRRHHDARGHQRTESKISNRAQAPTAPSAASDYLNHIVEGGMTQDQLDRIPGR